MKHLTKILALIAVSAVFCAGSWAVSITASAGSAAITPIPTDLDAGKMSTLTIDWVSHASAGTVTASLTGMPKLYLRGVDFIAGTAIDTATPTDNYDFVIRPVYQSGRKGKDLLGAVEDAAAADGPDAAQGLGIGQNLKSAATEDSADGNTSKPICIPFGATAYSVEGTNCGNSKQGSIVLYFSDSP
jgi:hypothetical protein